MSSFVFSPGIFSNEPLGTIIQKQNNTQEPWWAAPREVFFHMNHKVTQSKPEINSLKSEVSNFKFYSVFGKPEIVHTNARSRCQFNGCSEVLFLKSCLYHFVKRLPEGWIPAKLSFALFWLQTYSKLCNYSFQT